MATTTNIGSCNCCGSSSSSSGSCQCADYCEWLWYTVVPPGQWQINDCCCCGTVCECTNFPTCDQQLPNDPQIICLECCTVPPSTPGTFPGELRRVACG